MATLKQKKTFKNTLENGGVVSKAAKGIYSDSMAKNPQKITNTKGWEELMEQHIPDKLLAEKHNELLNAEIITRSYVKGELSETVEKMDSQAVSKGLDMGYKLKGRYAPEKVDNRTLNLNFDVKIDSKTSKLIQKFEKELYEKL